MDQQYNSLKVIAFLAVVALLGGTVYYFSGDRSGDFSGRALNIEKQSTSLPSTPAEEETHPSFAGCEIISFFATPSVIATNTASTLTWSTHGCLTSASISGIGPVNPNGGTISTGPLTTTTPFTLTANGGNVVNATITVTVGPQCVIQAFSATPPSIITGQTSTLSWKTFNCTAASISGIGPVTPVGIGSTTTPILSTTTAFTLTASNAINSATATKTVTVTAPPPCAINYFNALPASVTSGQTSTLKWSTTNCTSTTIDNNVGSVTPVSLGTVLTSPLTQTTTYKLTAQPGNITAIKTITVTAPPPCAISTFIANPTTIASGSSSTLSWATTNCTSALIDQNIGTVTVPTGTASTGTLTETKTFTITAQPGNVTKQTTITVTPLACTPNTWTQKADFGGTAREAAVGFSVDGKGYVGTGWDTALSKDFWEYDPSTNIWTQKADFGGSARTAGTGFSLNGKGYLGTGSIGLGNNSGDFWQYDPMANTWTQKADFSTARQGAVGFSIGSKGYQGTGSSNSYLKDFWQYDPMANTWTQKADFSTARFAAAGLSIDGKGYIAIGHDGNSFKKDFWQYDPTLNIWTQKADVGGTERNFATSFSIGSKG